MPRKKPARTCEAAGCTNPAHREHVQLRVGVEPIWWARLCNDCTRQLHELFTAFAGPPPQKEEKP